MPSEFLNKSSTKVRRAAACSICATSADGPTMVYRPTCDILLVVPISEGWNTINAGLTYEVLVGYTSFAVCPCTWAVGQDVQTLHPKGKWTVSSGDRKLPPVATRNS